jgi:hypothetical protein
MLTMLVRKYFEAGWWLQVACISKQRWRHNNRTIMKVSSPCAAQLSAGMMTADVTSIITPSTASSKRKDGVAATAIPYSISAAPSDASIVACRNNTAGKRHYKTCATIYCALHNQQSLQLWCNGTHRSRSVSVYAMHTCPTQALGTKLFSLLLRAGSLHVDCSHLGSWTAW